MRLSMIAIRNRWRVISAAAALVVATGLAVVAMITVTFSLKLLNNSLSWVRHTDEVLLQVARIETDLVAAESAERGYLLTGDDQYERNFATDRAALAKQFDALAKLVSDNPKQTQNLANLRQTAEARLQQLKTIIGIGHDNLGAAVAAVRAAAPQRLTDVVRDQLDSFRQMELDLRRQREEKATRDMSRTIGFAIGSTVIALLSGSVGLLALQRERDRYQERELQSELAHMARLNLVGETAAVLAHELNQPLTATTNYLSAARAASEASGVPGSARTTDILVRAIAQVKRATEIVRRLRSFVEKGEPTRTTEEIAKLFEDAVALLGMRSDGLTVRTHAALGLPKVIVDRVEIQQVLINLMRNAVEAMEESPVRELELSAIPSDGHTVQINVKDTGPGLSQNVADRLFQPFVSTKPNGMGVGLSICRTIILRNGGRIWTEPNPEGGTIFSFTLPRT
jgi:two-component system, LuxR family, sensor kinase FixL